MRRAHDEVVAVEEANDGCVGVEEPGRLAGHLLEHDRRVERRPQKRAEAGEALREHARPALALEELAALERALRRVAHVPREQHVLVREGAASLEEHDARVGLLATAGDRSADERAVALGGEQLAQLGVEAVVAGELRRGEDAPFFGVDRKGPGGRADPDGKAPADRVRQLVRAGEDDLVAGALEHDRRRAAERLGGRLRQRVESLLERERRAEHLGDPVEAALDLGLALALLEALGVVERQGGEAREGLDHLDVAGLETAGLAVADAEHSSYLAEPRDRRAHDVVEDRVRRAGRGLLGRCEVVGQDRAPRLERPADRALRRDLAADVPFRDAHDGAAAEQLAVGLEDPAVRGVGADERHDLLHEASDDRLEVQVAREHLGGLDERLLLPEALLVLAQQAGGVDGEAQLPGHGLGQRDLAGLPGPDLPAVQAEDPDHAVEDEDRRGDGRARSQGKEGVRAPEGGVLAELARRLHVGDRHGAAVARREVHGRQVRRLVAHGLDARRVPFGEHGHRLPLLAEADEAPCDADRLRGLLDRHLQDRVQVELGTDTAADLRDQPLALERDAQRLGGASPAEGEGRLAREALDDVDLGVREVPVGRPGHHHEHAGDLTLGDERDERGALGGDGLGEPPVDVGRGRDVVHRQRLARVRDVHDRARVLVEVERDLRPPVLLQAARGEAERAPASPRRSGRAGARRARATPRPRRRATPPPPRRCASARAWRRGARSRRPPARARSRDPRPRARAGAPGTQGFDRARGRA